MYRDRVQLDMNWGEPLSGSEVMARSEAASRALTLSISPGGRAASGPVRFTTAKIVSLLLTDAPAPAGVHPSGERDGASRALPGEAHDRGHGDIHARLHHPQAVENGGNLLRRPSLVPSSSQNSLLSAFLTVGRGGDAAADAAPPHGCIVIFFVSFFSRELSIRRSL